MNKSELVGQTLKRSSEDLWAQSEVLFELIFLLQGKYLSTTTKK